MKCNTNSLLMTSSDRSRNSCSADNGGTIKVTADMGHLDLKVNVTPASQGASYHKYLMNIITRCVNSYLSYHVVVVISSLVTELKGHVHIIFPSLVDIEYLAFPIRYILIVEAADDIKSSRSKITIDQALKFARKVIDALASSTWSLC